MNLYKAFEAFPEETNLIGQILASYTSLEVDLMNCVKSVQDDLDTVLKVIYRPRGETKRIEIADAMGYQKYLGLNLGKEFKESVSAAKYCVRIRNQYAHCIWWDDNSGNLAFANLEELAKLDDLITDLRGMSVKHVTAEILMEQLNYFEYVSDLLVWVLNEGLKNQGRQYFPIAHKPNAVNQPALFI